MNVAQSIRLDREQHPERYCPKCLWKEETRNGRKPCPRHSGAERTTTVNRTVDPNEGRTDRRAVSPTVALCSPPSTASRNHDEQCQCKLCDVDWIL